MKAVGFIVKHIDENGMTQSEAGGGCRNEPSEFLGQAE